MRRRSLALAAGLLTTTAMHCGARTGLPVPDREEEPPPIEPQVCLAFEARGQLVPLDILIMMDSSGSMAETAGVVSKWASVTSALGLFFTDPASAGLGVNLSYFPQVDPFIAAECIGEPLACGDPAACVNQNVCELSGLACATAADCELQGSPGDACVPVGFCEGSFDVLCSPGTALECPLGLGPCIEYAYCENQVKCEGEDYEIPDVFMDELPDVAESLMESLEDRDPGGLTPTRPALAGVLAQAEASVQERQRKAIVVLATDGFPTACDDALDESLFSPEIIGHVAELAAGGAEAGIQTFVIGVFTELEAADAQVNLDQVAQAGGTETAFIVTTASLTQDFAAALTEVRVAATACEYGVPAENAATDWSKAHVFVTPDLEERTELVQRESAAACTGESLEFYVDTVGGGTPILVLCPTTCSFLGNVETHPLEIEMECEPAPP